MVMIWSGFFCYYICENDRIGLYALERKFRAENERLKNGTYPIYAYGSAPPPPPGTKRLKQVIKLYHVLHCFLHATNQAVHHFNETAVAVKML